MTMPSRPGAYAWFVVFLLMLAQVLSFIDRQILNLMVGPIRADLGISDTQMSLLMGLSFALFYTLCGIPLARLADRGSRRLLITAGVVVWSLATALSGMAQRYSHLLLARVGVGVGESTLLPSGFSLISDYFPREQRATAISVFSMGIYFGSGLAFMLGGVVVHFAHNQGPVLLPLLGEVRPWQMVFLLLGGAGLLFSPLLLMISEPRRSLAASANGLPFTTVLAILRKNTKTLICHHFGFAAIAIATYGGAAWTPSYLIRVLGWSPLETGLIYGATVAVFGPLGIVLGGLWADRLARRGLTDATLRVGFYATLPAIPFVILFYSTNVSWLVVTLLAVCVVFLSMPFGVAPAGLQEVVPANMRAQASALYLFVVNLVGLGFGPTLIALTTDHVFADDLAVGYAIELTSVIALAAAAILLQFGMAPFRDSYARQRLTENAA